MGIEITSNWNNFKTYQDPTLKGKTLLGFQGSSFLDAGYFYAPYTPLMVTPNPFPSKEQIKEGTHLPIKIIKSVLKRAGYKINRDFEITVSKWAIEIVITARPGRRFTHYGQCRVSVKQHGKVGISWTYEPTPGGKASKSIDVNLADPNCFQTIADTIITAITENEFRPISVLRGYNKRTWNTSYYGKTTL